MVNITCGGESNPCAILIRSGEPLFGLDLIKKNRNLPKLSKSGKELTNGPGKLCKSMLIDKSLMGHDITKGEKLFIIKDNGEIWNIETTIRVNIDYAQDYINKPWRFFIKNNLYVSVK